MLQRIQTVYLLIIVGLMVATLFLPLALLQAGDQFYSFDATGVGVGLSDVGTFCIDGGDLYPGVAHHLFIQEKNPANPSVRI